jgi:hypothetical protein
MSGWLAQQTKTKPDIHHEHWRKKRINKAKRAGNSKLSANTVRQLEKHEREDYRVKAMHERRYMRIAELSKKCRDFRRYLKTLDKLEDDEDTGAVYSGVINVDLGDLIKSLPSLLTIEDRDRFLLVEETHRFINRIERRTFGKKSRRGYVRGDFGFDLPKGETYTLADVKTALRLT